MFHIKWIFVQDSAAAGPGCDSQMMQGAQQPHYAENNRENLTDVLLCVFLSFLSLPPPESAERLLQSPGELGGAAGAGQSDTVLLGDGRLHPGDRPRRRRLLLLLL